MKKMNEKHSDKDRDSLDQSDRNPENSDDKTIEF